MTSVFVLMKEIPYEGSTLIDVYGDYAVAIAVADEYNLNGHYGRYVVVTKEMK